MSSALQIKFVAFVFFLENHAKFQKVNRSVTMFHVLYNYT